jgi:hypothetical protein
MKIRFLCCFSASLALTSGLALRAADETPAPAAAAPAPAPAPGAKPAKASRPALEKGMTAEQVLKLIGKPSEIKPMPVPEGGTGKAEMWIYRRDGGTRTVQVPIGTRQVPGFVGINQPLSEQHRTEVIYGPKTIKIYQVTSLLMFNDTLMLARQTQETEERY